MPLVDAVGQDVAWLRRRASRSVRAIPIAWPIQMATAVHNSNLRGPIIMVAPSSFGNAFAQVSRWNVGGKGSRTSSVRSRASPLSSMSETKTSIKGC
jgi:hypothetical protein